MKEKEVMEKAGEATCGERKKRKEEKGKRWKIGKKAGVTERE